MDLLNGDEEHLAAESAMDVDLSQAFTVGRRLDSDSRASSLPLHPDTFATGYVYSAEMMLHSSEEEHPEKPERISKIYDILFSNGCLSHMKRIPIRRAKREEVLLVHSEAHWQSVLDLKTLTREDIINSEAYYDRLSLYVNPETPNASLLSCGGVVEATLAVARRELKKTFAIVRPPGHHAEPTQAMGFCFFNNVAVAVKVVQQLTPIKRILILDWDVHHGNGTQRAFNDDPSVLYMSLHRYEQGRFYPCGPFGSMESCGEGKGLGYSVNVPWPEKGTGDADYIHAFQHIVMPIATEFAPELVIISAGFDAAEGDPLGEGHVTPAGYAHMTHMLSGLAGGRLVVALEGGYNVDAIANSALAVGRMLLGEAPPEMPRLVASETATETVYLVAKEQSRYWKNINVRACEPREDIEETTFTIPELLKAHRQEYMYREFGMLEIPIMYSDMEDMFSSQVMCSPDFYSERPLIVFVHEFGNIRVEIANTLTCDVQLEHSYLVDASKMVMQWVKQEKYSLLDVNVFPKPTKESAAQPAKTAEEYAGDLMVYLWDNYVSMPEFGSKQVILVGHGPGVHGLTHLLQERTVSVMHQVQLVVQVVGNARIPLVPKKGPDVTVWYREHSLVIVPEDHPIIRDKRVLKRHGKLMPIDEQKPVKMMIRAMSIIRSHVKMILVGAVNGQTTSIQQ